MFHRLNKVSLFNKCSPTLDDISVCVVLAKNVRAEQAPSTDYADCIGHPQCSALHPTRLVASLHQTTGGKYIGFFLSNME